MLTSVLTSVCSFVKKKHGQQQASKPSPQAPQLRWHPTCLSYKAPRGLPTWTLRVRGSVTTGEIKIKWYLEHIKKIYCCSARPRADGCVKERFTKLRQVLMVITNWLEVFDNYHTSKIFWNVQKYQMKVYSTFIPANLQKLSFYDSDFFNKTFLRVTKKFRLTPYRKLMDQLFPSSNFLEDF